VENRSSEKARQRFIEIILILKTKGLQNGDRENKALRVKATGAELRTANSIQGSCWRWLSLKKYIDPENKRLN
jgi:hypothetical protein